MLSWKGGFSKLPIARRGSSTSRLFFIGLVFVFYCHSAATKGGAIAKSTQIALSDQLTQSEAERLALAELIKRNPDAIFKFYTFEKLVHVSMAPQDLPLNGYFLCGRIAFLLGGKTVGPIRIMVNFSNEEILNLILYDNPATGAHAASSLCNQVEEMYSNHPTPTENRPPRH